MKQIMDFSSTLDLIVLVDLQNETTLKINGE